MLKLYLSSSFKATGACSWEFKLCKIGCLPQQSSLILTLKLGMKIFYAEFNSVINLHTAYSEKKLEMNVMGTRLNDVVDGGSSLLWRHHRQFTFTIFFCFFLFINICLFLRALWPCVVVSTFLRECMRKNLTWPYLIGECKFKLGPYYRICTQRKIATLFYILLVFFFNFYYQKNK